MPLEAIRVSSPLPASAARVYAAWLDSLEHSRMTGGPATIEARIGGHHTAWDGAIEGEILTLEPDQRIVQTWRSREFPEGHPPSVLEIRLRDTSGGCEIWISHSEIPEGQASQYEAGWHERYFIPMTKYFRDLVDARETPRTEPQELAPPTPAAKAKRIAKPAEISRGKKAAKGKKAAAPKKASRGKKAAKAKAAPKKRAVAKKAKKAAKAGRTASTRKTAPTKAKPRATTKFTRVKAAKTKASPAKRKPGARRSARS
jgi:uncharacterized protein YndB with AHSA1/START domain